ncbi:hypothetical protein [Erwinia sp. JUb26]|uniref:hypothetical protein n=1 Tax=Erwinia sp. JUb26 TaxID=2485126 RepID=UPI000FB4CA6A|nr:hypothetical protein [Erwinia sp. JUb26]ROR15308.1 hypothetical protein EC836_101809 [Erwinia sp. JUb26]
MVLFGLGLGLGLAVGNWLGGRFADRSLFGTLYVTLIAPGIVPGSGGATIAAGFGLVSHGWAGAVLSFIALGLAFLAWQSARKGYILNAGSC